MNKITYKKIQLILVWLTCLVLFTSLYFQYVMGLSPCPLCIMQRACVFGLLIVMSLGLRTLKRAHFISLIQVLISCAGLFFSLRQLWLQSLPAGKVAACMPGLDVLIRYFPWQSIVQAFFWGASDCSEVTWSLWGISMSGWTALYFLLMTMVSALLYFNTRPLR